MTERGFRRWIRFRPPLKLKEDDCLSSASVSPEIPLPGYTRGNFSTTKVAWCRAIMQRSQSRPYNQGAPHPHHAIMQRSQSRPYNQGPLPHTPQNTIRNNAIWRKSNMGVHFGTSPFYFGPMHPTSYLDHLDLFMHVCHMNCWKGLPQGQMNIQVQCFPRELTETQPRFPCKGTPFRDFQSKTF